MLWRGVRRRCAWCGGQRAFFAGWFRKLDRCATCGIGWHRGYDGFELGAMAINVVGVFGVLIVGLVVGIVATSPDVAVFGLVAGLGSAAIVLPILAYPVSYTVWQAVDLAMHPPDLGDPDVPPYR